jgi:drug/metabolite transporter (DMT)-like permease
LVAVEVGPVHFISQLDVPVNTVTAIGIKLISVSLFAVTATLVRFLGEAIPVGQVVFFRSAFAIVPIVLVCGWRGELMAAVRTERPLGQVLYGLISIAGMFLTFAALARLQLVDVMAIGFASPLITIVLAALILKERVPAYRWFAVAVGFCGVTIMLWPYLDLTILVANQTPQSTIGAICAIMSALAIGGSIVQSRWLTKSERTSAIVFYYSLICAVGGLCTLPFAWHHPNWPQLVALIAIGLIGGIAHLLLIESFRFTAASVVAPFDYTSVLWAFLFGYVFFGELPNVYIFVGAAIVCASGLFIIWRERGPGIVRAHQTRIDGVFKNVRKAGSQ